MPPQKPQINLGDLQKRLNEDPKVLEKFLRDPVAVLKSEGITLSPDMAKDLKDFVQKSKAPNKKDAAIGPSGAPLRSKLGISIRIVIPF